MISRISTQRRSTVTPLLAKASATSAVDTEPNNLPSWPARAGQDGKLFGSVSTADVADAFAKSGVTVDRRWVEIREIIRTTGEFQGAVRLHPQVRATFKIQVQAAG